MNSTMRKMRFFQGKLLNNFTSLRMQSPTRYRSHLEPCDCEIRLSRLMLSTLKSNVYVISQITIRIHPSTKNFRSLL
jgi:hypothetical protein